MKRYVQENGPVRNRRGKIDQQEPLYSRVKRTNPRDFWAKGSELPSVGLRLSVIARAWPGYLQHNLANYFFAIPY